MIHWLKRLIAGRELDELERLRKERLDRGLTPYRCAHCGGVHLLGYPTYCYQKPFATDWDVAQAAQEPEGRVRYEHLGMTGLEEE
jgi:hypothetical protein